MPWSNSPTFTVAIPVYNGESYIAEAINSVLQQTYPHFEIVILENGSTDKTVEIVEKLTDSRIRMISSGQLLPIEENWARILEIENPNEFLVLMCADDILYTEFLEEIAELIQAEPAATLYHAHAVFINADSKISGMANPAAPTETADEFLNALHTFREDVFGTGYVMRFEDFWKVGGYPKFKRLLFADFYCYYRLTKLGYKACVQSKLIGFRRHAQGITSQSNLQDFMIAAKQYKAALQADGTIETEAKGQRLDNFLNQFMLSQYRRYLFQLIKQPGKRDFEMFEDFKATFCSENYVNRVYPYDFPLRWYVWLAENPFWWIRKPLYWLLQVGIRFRRFMMTSTIQAQSPEFQDRQDYDGQHTASDQRVKKLSDPGD